MSMELSHPQPIHPHLPNLVFPCIDIHGLPYEDEINTFTVEPNNNLWNFLFSCFGDLCCFVCRLCWFPLCILSLILTQTCRANCRTPLRHNHTREEISPLHCSLLETSFLPGHAPPHIPGPVCPSLAWTCWTQQGNCLPGTDPPLPWFGFSWSLYLILPLFSIYTPLLVACILLELPKKKYAGDQFLCLA